MTRRLERKNHELINFFLTLSITQDFRFYLTSFEPRKINFSELVFGHTMLYTFYLISHLCIFIKTVILCSLSSILSRAGWRCWVEITAGRSNVALETKFDVTR